MSREEGDLCLSCTFSSVSCRGIWDQVCWNHTSLLPSAHPGYQQEGHSGSSAFSSPLPDEEVVWVCRLRQQTPVCSTGVAPNWVSGVTALVRRKTFQLEKDQTSSVIKEMHKYGLKQIRGYPSAVYPDEFWSSVLLISKLPIWGHFGWINTASRHA